MARSSVWTVLTYLKDPGIVGFKKGDTVSPENCSAFNPRPIGDPQLLGMGYVKAIAALLQGAVRQVAISPGAANGRIDWLLAGRELELIWSSIKKDDDGNSLVVGGFAHSGGKPTYQVAAIGLVWRLAQLVTASGDPLADELVPRWWDLVRAMDEFAPRTSPTPWDVGHIQRAFTESEKVRGCVERVCDSLEWSLRLYDESGRRGDRRVEVETGVRTGDTDNICLTAEDMLVLVAKSETSETETVRSVTVPAGAEPARPDLTDAIPDGSGIFGPYIERIMSAMQCPGSLGMLVGPTATGKTTQAVEAARRLDCGVELVQLDPGKDAQELIGGFTPHQARNNRFAAALTGERWLDVWQVRYNGNESSGMFSTLRTASDTLLTALRGIARALYLIFLLLKAKMLEPNDWAPVDGPLTRWARRAIAGEQVVLILDELARGHPSVVALVMGVLNRHSRETIERQGLRVPPGSETAPAYHILDCIATLPELASNSWPPQLAFHPTRPDVLATLGADEAGKADRVIRLWELDLTLLLGLTRLELDLGTDPPPALRAINHAVVYAPDTPLYEVLKPLRPRARAPLALDWLSRPVREFWVSPVTLGSTGVDAIARTASGENSS